MKKIAIFTLSLILLISAIPITTNASSNVSNEEELAKVLEFMFEEAIVKDYAGKPLSIDFKKIEDEFGQVPELESLKKEVEQSNDQITIMINPSGPDGTAGEINRCIYNKIANEWKGAIGASAMAAGIQAVAEKDYLKGAKLLIKGGAKGSAYGIAGSLAWWYVTCI